MFNLLLTPKVKPLVDWFFIIGKAIWRTTTTTLILIVSSFLLHALVTYYKMDTSSVTQFFILIEMLVENWGLFWMVIFGSYLWDEYKWSKRRVVE